MSLSEVQTGLNS